LIPGKDFAQQANLFPADLEQATEAQFSDMANRCGVSREAVLRRFLDQKRVSKTFYESKARAFSDCV
jgi:Zn-dependent peptidase ImmA (M78 family)